VATVVVQPVGQCDVLACHWTVVHLEHTFVLSHLCSARSNANHLTINAALLGMPRSARSDGLIGNLMMMLCAQYVSDLGPNSSLLQDC
jgi:hypothetical protein